VVSVLFLVVLQRLLNQRRLAGGDQS